MTVLEHELTHFNITRNLWNSVVNVSRMYEGYYCNILCADQARSLVSNYYRKEQATAVWENTMFDINQYGRKQGGTVLEAFENTVNKSFNSMLEYENHVSRIAGAMSDCKKKDA